MVKAYKTEAIIFRKFVFAGEDCGKGTFLGSCTPNFPHLFQTEK